MTGLIVLDIDETMISSYIQAANEPPPKTTNEFDFNFVLQYEKSAWRVWIKKRPFLDQFLDYLVSNFRIAVFTAASRDYAREILRHLGILDKLEFFKSRESVDWGFDWFKLLVNIKKLKSIPDIDLSKTIMIDDTKEVAKRNKENLLKVDPFEWTNPRCDMDSTLLKVISVLEMIKHEPDWRPVSKKF